MQKVNNNTLYIRDPDTGDFKPIPCMVGPRGPVGGPLHIAYSTNPDGTNYSDTWYEGMIYIGVSVGSNAPTDKTGYRWYKFIGEDGAKGDSVHIRYSEFNDGTSFSTDWGGEPIKPYIGFAIGSEAPTYKEGYTWCRFLGLQGPKGDAGDSKFKDYTPVTDYSNTGGSTTSKLTDKDLVTGAYLRDYQLNYINTQFTSKHVSDEQHMKIRYELAAFWSIIQEMIVLLNDVAEAAGVESNVGTNMWYVVSDDRWYKFSGNTKVETDHVLDEMINNVPQ